MLYEITPEEKIKTFEETGDVDFAYEIPDWPATGSIFSCKETGSGAVFREIPSIIMTPEQLGLPPVMSKLAMLPRGLVLVTGPTGSGKSTTLAAIIDTANQNPERPHHHHRRPHRVRPQSQSCIINHREVGTHTRSFSAALRGALREDPDIIMVGEMRDLETISLALEAAATGHLVFSTLHTTSASKTVDRIIEVFPAHQQAQIRSTLADGIRAVVAQVLFKTGRQQGALRGPGDLHRHPCGPEPDSGIQDLPDPIRPSRPERNTACSFWMTPSWTCTTRGGSAPTKPI